MGFKAVSTSRSTATTTVSKQATVINSSSGFAVTGATITANSSISINVNTPGQAPTNQVSGISIRSINYLNANGTISTANAVSTSGGNIKINGDGFTSPMTVIVGGTTVANANITVANTTAMVVSLPSASPGNVSLYTFNSTGTGAQLANAVNYSGVPSWTTSTVSFVSGTAANVALVASSDSTLTYTLQAGSTLPTGISLISTGYLSGTATGYSSSTTGTFVIVATDLENQAAQQTITWSVQVADPQFNYTTLLLNGDTGNNIANTATNNTFLDSSTNNFTITRTGNPTQGTFSPFSQTGWSNYFTGSSILRFSGSGPADLGTGDFTVEMWVNISANTGAWQAFYDSRTGGTGFFFGLNNGGLTLIYYVGGIVITDSTPIVLGRWYHVALVRSSGTTKMYKDGVSVGTPYSDSTNYTSTVTDLSPLSGLSVNGYLSNARVLKGTALYTTNFTPPVSPLTAIANTQLLTCQSNRFVNNSSSSLTIATNGLPTIQAYGPFAPGAAYSPSSNGGSAYFDGTGDLLRAISSPAIGSGNYTIECWSNLATSAAGGNIAIFWVGGIGLWATGTNWRLYTSNGGSAFINATIAMTSVTSPAGQWLHHAVVRSGTTVTYYINGVSVYSTTDSNNYTLTGTYVGFNVDLGYYWTGQISGFRYVASAIYTSTFTPPTSPPTAVANTQLLLNFTNGGIADAHASMDIETVGAQLSTAVTKYGTASMSFSGSSQLLTMLASTPLLAFGTGDFTVEFWVNFNSTTGRQDIMWLAVTGSVDDRMGIIWNLTAGNLTYYISPTVANAINAAWTPSAGIWYHIALSRASGSSKLFINGVQTGSTYTDTRNYNVPYSLYVGQDSGAASSYFNGYLDDVRITKGFARYTANFTPPTSAFSGQ